MRFWYTNSWIVSVCVIFTIQNHLWSFTSSGRGTKFDRAVILNDVGGPWINGSRSGVDGSGRKNTPTWDIQSLFSSYLLVFIILWCLFERNRSEALLFGRAFGAFGAFPTRFTFAPEVTKIARLSLKLALSFLDRPASGFATGQSGSLEPFLELRAAKSTNRLTYDMFRITAILITLWHHLLHFASFRTLQLQKPPVVLSSGFKAYLCPVKPT